jgi:hypothetical protein
VIKTASRRAAIVLAASALTLVAGLLPAQAATAGWRTDATFAVRGEVSTFIDVAASSPADAWAVGFAAKTPGTSVPQPIIRHWTGRTWRLVTLPAKIRRELASQDAIFSVVGAASASKVWIFNFADDYLRLDGSRWSLGQLPGASQKSGALVLIDAAEVFSGNDVWAFGLRISASLVETPYAAHYDGRTWSRVTMPGLPGGALVTAVAAVSSGDIWAAESGLLGIPASVAVRSAVGRSVVARSAVAASPGARLAVARLRAARLRAAASDSAASSQVVLHWTAKTGWQDAAQQPNLNLTDQLVTGVAERDGHVWFGGSANNSANGTSSLTAEWNGTSWSVSDLPGKASSALWQLEAMTPDGAGGIWALAQDSNSGAERIWHLQGANWSQARPHFGKHPWDLEALALVPRARSVWAVGAVEVSKSSVKGLIAVDGPLPR